MTVGDLIEKLSKLDQSLPICLSEFNEGSGCLEGQAEKIAVVDFWYYPTVNDDRQVRGRFVCLGDHHLSEKYAVPQTTP